MKEALLDLKAIGALPVPWEQRAAMLIGKPLAKITFGCEVSVMPSKWLSKCRVGVKKAMIGHGRGTASPDLIFSLLTKGHVVCPKAAIEYKRLTAYRDMVANQEEWKLQIRVLWEAYDAGARKTPGPIGMVRDALKKLGWRARDYVSWVTHEGAEIHVLNTPKQAWQHAIREALRALMLGAASKRADVGDCTEADRVNTVKMLEGMKGEDQALMRSVVMAGVPTMARLHKQGVVDSPMCPYCLECPETLDHRWWVCVDHEPERQKVGIKKARWLAQVPHQLE